MFPGIRMASCAQRSRLRSDVGTADTIRAHELVLCATQCLARVKSSVPKLHSKQDRRHIFSRSTSELQERSQVADLVVQNLGASIGVLGVPVHASDAAFIRGPVHGFDQ